MSGPFENRFLGNTPAWLRPTNRKVRGAVFRSEGNTSAPVASVAAAAGLLVSMAFCAAVFGPSPRAPSASHEFETVAIVAEAQSDAELAWHDYLNRLRRGRLQAAHVEMVKQVWTQLRAMNPALAPPQAAPSHEDALSMVWDAGPHHVEVDVHPTKLVEWFYTNRSTGLYEGEDDNKVHNLSKKLRVHVEKLA